MIIKTGGELHQLVKNVLLAAGADEPNAADVAEHLVLANLSGVDTHGIWHLPRYVESSQSGEIVATAHPEILNETATSAQVTGNWTYGQVAAKYAIEVAITKAKENDIAVVGLVQADHIGRLGHYVEMAAAERLIAMVWAEDTLKKNQQPFPTVAVKRFSIPIHWRWVFPPAMHHE